MHRSVLCIDISRSSYLFTHTSTQSHLTPSLRPLCLHYGYDEAVWGLTEQYLVGTQFLAAPVLYEGAVSVEVYFPKHSGTWVHTVSGRF